MLCGHNALHVRVVKEGTLGTLGNQTDRGRRWRFFHGGEIDQYTACEWELSLALSNMHRWNMRVSAQSMFL